ncbi:MAG: uroporphyrinogen-III C-methyltransferase [Vicinamibacterales bacterium]|nr:uroporphyrinogen-III C-methyltransferase [Vicinamibacterales bacterium]
MTEARIFLIGAGPGDPSLLTVKGHRYLTTADVVVYDHLVHQQMLSLVRPDAETIDVGPAAPRPLEQDAFCLLLAEKAREGKTVARLKWGDPFVFDSGGKEALFLHEQGLGFEVVPGIPSSIGSPAYAGIPVTYPEAGDTLTLVRGHEGDTSVPPRVAWSRLARVKGTIVTYATGPQLAAMVKALRRHGRPASEPAALIYRGTLPSQHTIQGTLEEVEKLVSRPAHREAAVLVVGRVAALRDHLRWYDTRPLFGMRIVVTRARAQAAELVTRLAQLGADPIEAPTIQIVPPEDPAPLDDACAQIASFDWVVFTSANAVSHFMHHLLAGPGDVRDLKGVQLCAVGPVTAEALARYGITIDLVPDEYRAEAVIRALGVDRDLTGRRVLLPRADLARDLLPEKLRQAGADVTAVIAYQTAPVDLEAVGGPDIYRMLLEQRVDLVTFTSGSSVRNFVTALGTDQAADLLKRVDVACIGPVTADEATRLDISTTIMPSEYTVPAMVRAIVEHVQVRRRDKEGD